jgi:ribonuclease J
MLVLMRLKKFAKIPQPEWKGGHMRTVVTRKMMGLMERLGEPELIEYLKGHRAAMSADKLPMTPEKWVIMARSSLVDDYRGKGVVPTKDDTWVWSMWNGYLEQESTRPMREFFTPCQKAYIHSSGHASPDILQKFAEAMRPKLLIPVHGECWQTLSEHFSNLRVVMDGEWLGLNS